MARDPRRARALRAPGVVPPRRPHSPGQVTPAAWPTPAYVRHTEGSMTRETGLAAIAFATLVCAPRASKAKCAYQRVEAFPPASARLPVNGRIVVEGYGEAQSM